jgi:hypothetical protein
MVYILIYIGVIVVVIIGATLWGKFDPKVKATNAEYLSSKGCDVVVSLVAPNNKITIHRSLNNKEVIKNYEKNRSFISYKW